MKANNLISDEDDMTSVEKLYQLLQGKCPCCNDKVVEITLSHHQRYTHRVLCLGCKAHGDGFSFGGAYAEFKCPSNNETMEGSK